MQRTDESSAPFVTVFPGGDVMTGRGVGVPPRSFARPAL
jgi:hypothetical protein